MPGGVYRVNDAMLADARSDHFIEHVSKLACVVADVLGREGNVPCFIVDPVSTDEMADIRGSAASRNCPARASRTR